MTSSVSPRTEIQDEKLSEAYGGTKTDGSSTHQPGSTHAQAQKEPSMWQRFGNMFGMGGGARKKSRGKKRGKKSKKSKTKKA